VGFLRRRLFKQPEQNGIVWLEREGYNMGLDGLRLEGGVLNAKCY